MAHGSVPGYVCCFFMFQHVVGSHHVKVSCLFFISNSKTTDNNKYGRQHIVSVLILFKYLLIQVLLYWKLRMDLFYMEINF